MNYLIRTTFNGRVRYYYSDNRTDADYLFDVITADLRNGEVQLWNGNDLLTSAEKVQGKRVL